MSPPRFISHAIVVPCNKMDINTTPYTMFNNTKRLASAAVPASPFAETISIIASTIDKLPRTPAHVMTGSHSCLSRKSVRRTRPCTPNTVTARTRIMITKNKTIGTA